MRLRIKAEKVEAKYLKPGELYSTVGSEYWATATDKSPFQTVQMRTNAPLDDGVGEEEVYRIIIEYVDADGVLAKARRLDPNRAPGKLRV